MTRDHEDWQPRPDPAVTDPNRPGLRAHRHPPNRMHAWVFQQQQVWVDYWGNEHEIESMDVDYVRNVIAFCLLRAEAILDLTCAEGASAVVDMLLLRIRPTRAQRAAMDALLVDACDPVEWLVQMPLIRALRRRLETGGDQTPEEAAARG
jgi:hypothetical protein